MLSIKKVGKGTRTRHQPIYLTNFYKYSYLTISIRLFNLFLDDFLDKICRKQFRPFKKKVDFDLFTHVRPRPCVPRLILKK